ncbi:hypothetical protein ACJX0J_033233, partial [Zea mays]
MYGHIIHRILTREKNTMTIQKKVQRSQTLSACLLKQDLSLKHLLSCLFIIDFGYRPSAGAYKEEAYLSATAIQKNTIVDALLACRFNMSMLAKANKCFLKTFFYGTK